MVASDVSGAIFTNSNLSNANLSNLKNWKKIRNISGARISNVKNAPHGFAEWANQHGAISD